MCFELIDIIYEHLSFIFDDGRSGKPGILDRVNAVIVFLFKLDYHFGQLAFQLLLLLDLFVNLIDIDCMLLQLFLVAFHIEIHH